MTRSSYCGAGAATTPQVFEHSEEGLCVGPLAVRSYHARADIESCGVRSNHCRATGKLPWMT
jgi:hypothetical protein